MWQRLNSFSKKKTFIFYNLESGFGIGTQNTMKPEILENTGKPQAHTTRTKPFKKRPHIKQNRPLNRDIQPLAREIVPESRELGPQKREISFSSGTSRIIFYLY